MARKLFRQSEQELGTSPEELQDYVRVTNPLVWTILIAVVLLLAGGIVAASFGRVEVTMNAPAFVTSGQARIEVSTPNANKLKEGQKVRFPDKGKETYIAAIEWLSTDLAEATFAVDLPDSTTVPYFCVVVTDVVSPIDFLIH